jgi:hypothetical protein
MAGTMLASLAGSLLVLLTNVPEGLAQDGAPSGGRSGDVRTGPGGHLRIESTLFDLLHHPAFAGFAPLILSWDDRTYNEQMPLARIGSLLPYHRHVPVETVAGALNRMIDEADRGRTVFYRFYSDVEREHDEPAGSHAGLFFFGTCSR